VASRPKPAALCALRAGPAEVEIIRQKLEVMEEAFHSRAGMSSDEDWDFHQAIYRVSGNPLFEQIISAMHELFQPFLGASAGRPRFRPRQLSYHRTVYERIAAGDAEGARGEALKLIATVEADLRRGERQSQTCGIQMNSEFERDFIAEAATLLAHDEPFPAAAVVPPIYQTSLFTFDSYAEMADVFAGRKHQADLFARQQPDGHGIREQDRRP
jgi:hypothetical protein